MMETHKGCDDKGEGWNREEGQERRTPTRRGRTTGRRHNKRKERKEERKKGEENKEEMKEQERVEGKKRDDWGLFCLF